jgi:hypothetical protein
MSNRDPYSDLPTLRVDRSPEYVYTGSKICWESLPIADLQDIVRKGR